MSSVTAQSPDSSPSPPSPPTPSSSSAPPPSSSTPPTPPSSSPPPPDNSTPAAPPPKSGNNNSTTSPPPKSSPPPPPESKPSPPPPTPSNNGASTPPPSPPAPSRNGSTTPQLSSPPPPRPSSSNDSSPSPPSQPQKSPSSGNSSSPSSDSGSPSSGSSFPSGAAIGVVVGVVVVLLVAVSVSVICMRKRKKKNKNHMQYYGNQPPQGLKGGNYYNNPQQNWQSSTGQQGGDHVVRLNPPPGGMNNSGGGWNAQPPPPPPFSNSGEMRSSVSGAPLPPPSPGISMGGFNKCTFTYDELAAATSGFSQQNVLGQGGFGFVHKGVLPSGKEVAVKSLKTGSGQGEREFQAEVEIISRVHHRHLVSLEGYCIAGGQRMLVYEFVPNKTLEYHLHSKHLPVMDCQTRLRIATGSAKGLAYLHEDCHPRIIHRDIKSANILIDYNFEAMVADFGLAKLNSDNYTHVSTRVMGTFGYLAPEYASSGKLTEKSDVFSFGIMLLELITGRRPVDPDNTMDDSLVDWARPLLSRALEESNCDPLVDPRLENNYNQHEMLRMIAAAAACIRHSARKRPKMSQIVRALEGDVSLDEIHEGVKPGQSPFVSPGGSSEYDTMAYNADMKRFRQVALSSQEFPSGEFGSSSNESRDMSSHNGQHKF